MPALISSSPQHASSSSGSLPAPLPVPQASSSWRPARSPPPCPPCSSSRTQPRSSQPPCASARRSSCARSRLAPYARACPASPRHRSSLACPSARRVSPMCGAPGMLAGAQLHRAPLSPYAQATCWPRSSLRSPLSFCSRHTPRLLLRAFLGSLAPARSRVPMLAVAGSCSRRDYLPAPYHVLAQLGIYRTLLSLTPGASPWMADATPSVRARRAYVRRFSLCRTRSVILCCDFVP
jgi:hypothetical protein